MANDYIKEQAKKFAIEHGFVQKDGPVVAQPEAPAHVETCSPEEEVRVAEQVVKEAMKDLGAVYSQGAFSGGNMVVLRRGSSNREAITFLHDQLVNAGLLKNGEIPSDEIGFMNGTKMTTAVCKLQELMHNAGADIKLEEPENAVVYTQVWAALRAVNECGGKAALEGDEKKADVVARYNQIRIEYAVALAATTEVGAANTFAGVGVKPTALATAVTLQNGNTIV